MAGWRVRVIPTRTCNRILLVSYFPLPFSTLAETHPCRDISSILICLFFFRFVFVPLCFAHSSVLHLVTFARPSSLCMFGNIALLIFILFTLCFRCFYMSAASRFGLFGSSFYSLIVFCFIFFFVLFAFFLC